MEDKELPKSYGEEPESPISFPEKEELCQRLDELYRVSGVQLKIPPSAFLEGALFALRYKGNPDLMAQVAHSLREILYKFKGGSFKTAFTKFGSTYEKERIGQDIGNYYNFITNIAHHDFEKVESHHLIGGTKEKPVDMTPQMFEDIVLRFGKVLFALLRRQVEVHKEIDDILSNNP